MASSTAAAPTIKVLRRLDYKPVAFTTKTTQLKFVITPGLTTVEAEMTLEQNYKPAADESAPRSVILNHGDAAGLTLKSISIDGSALTSSEYVLDDKTLTFTPPAGAASSFKLRIVTEINPEKNTALEVRIES